MASFTAIEREERAGSPDEMFVVGRPGGSLSLPCPFLYSGLSYMVTTQLQGGL